MHLRRIPEEPWVVEAKIYLQTGRDYIQNRFMDTFRFIDLSEKNSKTFSYEYSSILRDAGSVFASVMHAYLVGINNDSSNSSIGDYRKILINAKTDMYNLSVGLKPHKDLPTIIPFSAFEIESGVPKWWTAYNKLKHSEYDHMEGGNLGNTIHALAALVLVEYLFGNRRASDELWANVGIIYPVSDPSFKNRPFIEFE